LEEAVKNLVLVLLVVVVLLVLAAPPTFPADKQTMQEFALVKQALAQLQSDLRDMRSAVDERMGVMRGLVEQQSATVKALNTSLDGVQRSVQNTVTAQGAKVDSVAGNVQAANDSLADVRARIDKLSQQMAAMRTALETLQAPPPAPAQPAQPAAPPDPKVLYQNAGKDFYAANYGMAMSEFQDYLKFYPTDEYASNAQFWIGEIFYRQGKFNEAIDAYNAVIDRYQNSNKTADAHLKKGMALVELKDIQRRKPSSVR